MQYTKALKKFFEATIQAESRAGASDKRTGTQ